MKQRCIHILTLWPLCNNPFFECRNCSWCCIGTWTYIRSIRETEFQLETLLSIRHRVSSRTTDLWIQFSNWRILSAKEFSCFSPSHTLITLQLQTAIWINNIKSQGGKQKVKTIPSPTSDDMNIRKLENQQHWYFTTDRLLENIQVIWQHKIHMTGKSDKQNSMQLFLSIGKRKKKPTSKSLKVSSISL